MNVGANRVVLELGLREHVTVRDAKGMRLDCCTGHIWITEEGVLHDVVLAAGESYEISKEGAAIVHALDESVVVACRAQASRAELISKSWIERLRSLVPVPGRSPVSGQLARPYAEA